MRKSNMKLRCHSLGLPTDCKEPRSLGGELPHWCTHLNMMRLCRLMRRHRSPEYAHKIKNLKNLALSLAAHIDGCNADELIDLLKIASRDLMFPINMRIIKTDELAYSELLKIEAILSTYTLWMRGRTQLTRFSVSANKEDLIAAKQAYTDAAVHGSQWCDILIGSGASSVWMMQAQTILALKVYKPREC